MTPSLDKIYTQFHELCARQHTEYLSMGLDLPKGISLPMRTFDTIAAALKSNISLITLPRQSPQDDTKQVASFTYYGVDYFRGLK